MLNVVLHTRVLCSLVPLWAGAECQKALVFIQHPRRIKNCSICPYLYGTYYLAPLAKLSVPSVNETNVWTYGGAANSWFLLVGREVWGGGGGGEVVVTNTALIAVCRVHVGSVTDRM